MRNCKQGKGKCLDNEREGTTKERVISERNKIREKCLKRDEMVGKRKVVDFCVMTV
jgi:hypothetical protein